MSNVTALPIPAGVRADAIIDRGLNEHRDTLWAINYHRKLVHVIENYKHDGGYYSEHEGELMINFKVGIDLEVEQALRALISRINELEEAM